jgi:hypothetical protein
MLMPSKGVDMMIGINPERLSLTVTIRANRRLFRPG